MGRIIKVDIHTDQGLYREYMEDTVRYAQLDLGRNGPAYFVGVYDGHGGDKVSVILAEVLHELLEYKLRQINITNEKVLKNVITEAYHKLDECMYQELGNEARDGSTAIVALYVPKMRMMYLINTGDSRAVLWDGVEMVKTIDHKPNDEIKRVQAAGGFVFASRVNGVLAVSRAFGDFMLKKRDDNVVRDGPVIVDPDIISIDVTGDKDYQLVLASDGLWDVFKADDKNIYMSAEELVEYALENGSTDNVGVITVNISTGAEETSEESQGYKYMLSIWDHTNPEGSGPPAKTLITTSLEDLGDKFVEYYYDVADLQYSGKIEKIAQALREGKLKNKPNLKYAYLMSPISILDKDEKYVNAIFPVGKWGWKMDEKRLAETPEDPDYKVCPYCKHKIHKNAAFMHELNCKKHSWYCEKCKDYFPMSQKEEHEEEHSLVQCGCGEMVEKGLMSEHMKYCPDREVQCKYCELPVLAKDLTDHENDCGNRTEKCEVCEKRVLVRDYDFHLATQHPEIRYQLILHIWDKKSDGSGEPTKTLNATSFEKLGDMFIEYYSDIAGSEPSNQVKQIAQALRKGELKKNPGQKHAYVMDRIIILDENDQYVNAIFPVGNWGWKMDT